MTTFKDYLQSDLETFFNMDEFATEVKIDGRTIKVIIDNDQLKEYQLRRGGGIQHEREGLSKGELLFHARVEDFEEEPFVDQIIRFNSKLHRITEIQENEGMYTITLVGYRS